MKSSTKGNLGRATAETRRAKVGLWSGRHEDEVHKSSLALDGHRLDSEQTRIWLVKTRSRSRCWWSFWIGSMINSTPQLPTRMRPRFGLTQLGLFWFSNNGFIGTAIKLNCTLAYKRPWSGWWVDEFLKDHLYRGHVHPWK